MLLKNAIQGYGYKYTDKATIIKALNEQGISVEQETRTETNGEDYIYTRIIDKDGKAGEWRRGARIVNAQLSGKSNPAQEYGSALTYASRYSLILALGIGCEDDDGEKLTGAKERKMGKLESTEMITKVQQDEIDKLNKELGYKPEEILKDLAYFKISKFTELTKKQADTYINGLKNRKEAKDGK